MKSPLLKNTLRRTTDSYVPQQGSLQNKLRQLQDTYEKASGLRYTDIIVDPKLTENQFSENKGVRLHEKEGPNLVVVGPAGRLEITCRDLSVLTWGIYQNAASFRKRFGIFAKYRDDIDGSGRQLIEVGDAGSKDPDDFLITAIFSTSHPEDWIYEADLMRDGIRDYHQTKNLGKHRFGADYIQVNIPDPNELLFWINESYLPWFEELSRLSKPHGTLAEWVASGLDMNVRCSGLFCENTTKVIPLDNLKKLLASGATLETLRERLVCSTCGKQHPTVSPL